MSRRLLIAGVAVLALSAIAGKMQYDRQQQENAAEKIIPSDEIPPRIQVGDIRIIRYFYSGMNFEKVQEAATATRCTLELLRETMTLDRTTYYCHGVPNYRLVFERKTGTLIEIDLDWN